MFQSSNISSTMFPAKLLLFRVEQLPVSPRGNFREREHCPLVSANLQGPLTQCLTVCEWVLLYSIHLHFGTGMPRKVKSAKSHILFKGYWSPIPTWFSDSSWVSYKSTQFCYCLPRDSTCFHRLRVSPTGHLALCFRCQSQAHVVTCASDPLAKNQRCPQPPLWVWWNC